MKKLLLIFILFISLITKSQLCYNVTSPAYAPDPYNAGTNLNLFVDDVFSNAVNLPFQFCFDGVIYNQVLISSNGYLSFNLGMAGGYSDWMINGAIPTNLPNTITNSILGTWQDIDVSVGGNIFYATYGLAPNRRFVVSWNNIPMYNCNGRSYTGQIALYETSYNIEVRIQTKQVCPLANIWNNNWAIEGVNNQLGTVAVAIAGRNATSWTLTNDSRRFTNCSVCTPLAVELLEFKGGAKSNYNQLEWITATEHDNDYFILESSIDAVNFKEIGRINGNDNSNHNINYNFKDYNINSNKIMYYQLINVDNQEVRQYSNVIAIENQLVEKKIVKILNILGQEISSDYEGVKIIHYSDGSVVKQY